MDNKTLADGLRVVGSYNFKAAVQEKDRKGFYDNFADSVENAGFSVADLYWQEGIGVLKQKLSCDWPSLDAFVKRAYETLQNLIYGLSPETIIRNRNNVHYTHIIEEEEQEDEQEEHLHSPPLTDRAAKKHYFPTPD